MAVDYVYLAKKKKKGTGEEEGGYGKDKDGAPVLAEVSVAASPLATVTIVPQCGSEVRLRMEALSSTLWSFEQHLEASWFQPGGLNLIAHLS